MRPEGLLEVGRIGRAHGIHGDVFLSLTTNRTERADVGSELWGRDQWFVITESSVSNQRWRVHIDGVGTRSAAEALTGTVLYAEPVDDSDALWVHRLIGASVIDVSGIDRGRCVSVIDNPASDLIELESGALVPVTFVTAVDDGPLGMIVTVDTPDGLFELIE